MLKISENIFTFWIQKEENKKNISTAFYTMKANTAKETTSLESFLGERAII